MERPRNILLTLVLGLALAIMIGWLMVIGRSILIPVVMAVISVYVLNTATEVLQRLPVMRRFPAVLLRMLVLAGFTLVLFAIGLLISVTVRELAVLAPTYEARIEQLVIDVTEMFNVETERSYTELRREAFAEIDFQSFLLAFLGSVTTLGATVFLVVVYAVFLMSETGTFSRKIQAAFPDAGEADRIRGIIADINDRIGKYLAVKTLINIVLGAISYVVLWATGVDFALFWALLIALFNYIPYVGSLIGVMFPVAWSVAQFGSMGQTVVLAALLTGAQVFVGNYVEPRWIGRELNLSPFIVILSLSIWSALWGLPGAILAIPLTSVIGIILSSFDATRFIPILAAQRVPGEGENEPAKA